MANIYISLLGQGKGEPNGSFVEYLRTGFQKALKQETGEWGLSHRRMMSKGVDMVIPERIFTKSILECIKGWKINHLTLYNLIVHWFPPSSDYLL